MRKHSIIIILGTAHRLRYPGKQSPDGRLHEAIYSRERVKGVAAELRAYGYHVMTDYEPLDLPTSMQSNSHVTETSRELAMRVATVNKVCQQEGAANVLYVSIHVDASGSDGQWHSPNGWSVRVSPKASAESKLLANCLFDVAKVHGLHMRQPLATQKYWPQSLKVLNDTACPAVLTENLFQDNLDDVDFLLSDEGRHVIERLHVEGIIKYIESL